MAKICKICSCDYPLPEGGYDEFFTADGNVRPAMRSMLRRLDGFGKEEFAHRRERIRHVRNENDLVSFSRNRHDNSDPLPIPVQPEEWAFLEHGLAQRIRIFDALAADIYGEQSLWKRGILPPSLLHANPGFMQVVWQVMTPGNIRVHLSGCDVMRGADGNFYAVNDHLQIPAGLGNALENRLAVSRALPELFRDLRAERLAGFFKKFQECLAAIQQTNSPDSRMVLLASGPGSANRNEDAVLARYLGLQLVENDDLAVRGLFVHLKTLAGLKRIGTIFRRVEDNMCDPLELRIDSGEGAVGIISAVRAGNLAMANALGTGALESPHFKLYLKTVCEELLGEEQILPDLPSVWMGSQNEDAAAVLQNPNDWSFQTLEHNALIKTYAKLTPTGQLSLLEHLTRRPQNFLARRNLGGATVPVWQNHAWQPSTFLMRFFAANTLQETTVMPGGYGICLNQDQTETACEKDIWVLSEHPVNYISLLAPADQPLTLSRAGGDLPSRAADNLYQLGRAMEAAEMTARLTRGIAVRLSDQSWTNMPELPFLFQAGGDAQTNRFAADPESTLRSLVLKKDNRRGLQIVLEDLAQLAVQLRDRLSEDSWLLLCNLTESKKPDGSGAAVLLPYLQLVLTNCMAFSGLTAESMTRGHGWRFLEIGRRLERSTRVLELLKHTLVRPAADEVAQIQLLQSLLEIGDLSMTYHRRYGGRLQVPPVIDLFLCDESNPRSVAYQIGRIKYEVGNLPNASGELLLSSLDRELLRLLTDLRLADVRQLAAIDNGCRREMESFANSALAATERIAEVLNRLYLNHAPRCGGFCAMATEV